MYQMQKYQCQSPSVPRHGGETGASRMGGVRSEGVASGESVEVFYGKGSRFSGELEKRVG